METFDRQIFEQIGNLFYALAAEQHSPSITSGKLKMAVRRDWLSGEYGADAQNVSEPAHLVGLTIDALENQQTPYADAFAAFEDFYRKNEERFSAPLKNQIVEAAETIMRILPPAVKRNECYERLKKLLYVQADAALSGNVSDAV